MIQQRETFEKKLFCFSLSLPHKIKPHSNDQINLNKVIDIPLKKLQGNWVWKKVLNTHIESLDSDDQKTLEQTDYVMKKMAFIVNQLISMDQPTTALIAAFVCAKNFKIAQEASVLYLVVQSFNDELKQHDALFQDNNLQIDQMGSAKSLCVNGRLFIGFTLDFNIKLNLILYVEESGLLTMQLDIFNTKTSETTTFSLMYEPI